MVANRPDIYYGICFNRDPGDATTASTWADFTANLLSVSDLARGKDYELGQALAADPLVRIRDVDENLNVANTSSPYAGLIEPYRETCLLGVWPNPCAGNLVNSGTWRGNKIAAYDPSFESYADGAAAPNWMTAVGGVTPAITTSNPQQGTKSVTYSVASTATRQGISWPVWCIPGRQYTASAYVRQATASTQVIAVGDATAGVDRFARTTASGWGTATGVDAGGAWTVTGGAAADYSTSAATQTAAQSNTALNTPHYSTISANVLDSTTYVTVSCPVIATGATIDIGVVSRYADASNHYRAFAQFNTDSTVSLRIVKRVAGVDTTLATLATGLTYTAGQQFRLKSTTAGNTMSARIYPATQTESARWDTGNVTDASISVPGAVGCRSIINTGNTNTLPVAATFTAFSSIGVITGTSTTSTGAYVRLSVTFTASQPGAVHVAEVVTQGTAVAGAVNIDAIQHEQGAAASAFTTTGSVIYPIFRNYAERFTKRWSSAGFEGFIEAPCVDAFAALNAIKLSTEYAAAIASTSPVHYWRLNDGTDTEQFADTASNGGPPMQYSVSKYGTGIAPVPQTAITMAGDSGATGVKFTATGTGVNWTQAGTSLGIGQGNSTIPIYSPSSTTPTWSISAAAWYAAVPNGEVQQVFGAFQRASVTNRYWYSPFDINLFGNTLAGSFHDGGFSANVGSTTPNAGDGNPHFVVMTVTQDATNTTLKLYYDGALNSTNVIANSFFGGPLAAPASTVCVGGLFDGSNFGRMLGGTVAHCATWDREITGTEVMTLWNAGLGYVGETTGARTARHLALGAYVGATRISAGSTTMQAPTWTGSIDLLSDMQATTVAEQGTSWVAPDGAVVLEGRQDRWLRLDATLVLGENTAGGEYPYLGDIVYDFDPMYVYPDVQVTRNNGTTTVGGTAADVATASRRYFPRSYSASVDVQTDQIAQDIADWVFNTHDAPLLRLEDLVLDPSSNPVLWPVALGLEIGRRITVKRRAKAANAGAGITMSSDFFVEKVATPQINFETGEWTVRLQLSPIGAGPGVTMQPWILGDSRYSVLGQTTVLGW